MSWTCAGAVVDWSSRSTEHEAPGASPRRQKSLMSLSSGTAGGQTWRSVRRCGGSRLYEAGLISENDGLSAVMQVELGEDTRDVGLDGGVAEDQFAGDVGVREATCEEA